ncbi:alpha-L-fucosidase, partial [Verrucomicrobiota bacterium]
LKKCIRMLSGAVTGDGNLLLNVGPMADGRIDPKQAERLAEMGEWVRANEDAIYDTRGGPYTVGAWGGSVHKDNKIYLHLFDFYEGEHLFPVLPKKILKCRALNGAKVDMNIDDKGMHIRVPEKECDPYCTVVELTIDGQAGKIPLIEMPKRPYAYRLQYGKRLSDHPKVDYEVIPATTDPRELRNRWINGNVRKYLVSDLGPASNVATDPALNPYVIIDLTRQAEIKLVEVINRYNRDERHGGKPMLENANLRVWISEDRKNWEEVHRSEEPGTKWIIKPTRFSAGIDLPGVKGRYVKVGTENKEPTKLYLRWVKIFGEEGSE